MAERRPAGHCFVVPAHGESPFLVDCLRSLREQSRPSDVLISTSTPSPFISAAAARFNVPVVEAAPGGGIGADWNAALRAAPTKWVTLAHQDDIYLPDFGKKVCERLAKDIESGLCFTGYRELDEDGPRPFNRNLAVKRLLIEFAYLGSDTIHSRRRKTALLAFGSPIPCPSVTFNLARWPDFRFSTDCRVNVDWKAWLGLVVRSGAFSRIKDVLMYHRVHTASETSARIADGTRAREDEECFFEVWPRPIAQALARLYRLSYASNTLRSEMQGDESR